MFFPHRWTMLNACSVRIQNLPRACIISIPANWVKKGPVEGPQMTFISFKSCAKVPGFWWSPISNSHWLLWAPSHLQLPPHRPQAPAVVTLPSIWWWFIRSISGRIGDGLQFLVNYHIYQPDISQLSSHYGWLMVVIYIYHIIRPMG